jgi:hypothetical protein
VLPAAFLLAHLNHCAAPGELKGFTRAKGDTLNNLAVNNRDLYLPRPTKLKKETSVFGGRLLEIAMGAACCHSNGY